MKLSKEEIISFKNEVDKMQRSYEKELANDGVIEFKEIKKEDVADFLENWKGVSQYKTDFFTIGKECLEYYEKEFDKALKRFIDAHINMPYEKNDSFIGVWNELLDNKINNK